MTYRSSTICINRESLVSVASKRSDVNVGNKRKITLLLLLSQAIDNFNSRNVSERPTLDSERLVPIFLTHSTPSVTDYSFS